MKRGLLIVLLVVPVALGQVAIDSCQTIGSPGSYELNQSLNTTGDCLVINANDVHLDCAGFTIDGDDGVGDWGILLNNSVNVSVSRCVVTDFDIAVRLEGANASRVEHGSYTSNDDSVFLSNTYNASVYNNSFDFDSRTDVHLENSDFNQVYDNSFVRHTLQYHVQISTGANENDVYNNSFSSGGIGVRIVGTSFNRVYQNTFSDQSSTAVFFDSSASFNNVSLNTMTGSGSFGAVLIQNGVHDNLIFNNSFLSGVLGVKFRSFAGAAPNNTFYYNNFSGNTDNIDAEMGGNHFNATIDGKNVGNFYDDVVSLQIFDTDQDGAGDFGTQYPYNSSSSAKVIGDATDYAPLGARFAFALSGNESNVTTTGVSALNIVVDGGSVVQTFLGGLHNISFFDGIDILANFTHDFSARGFDFANVTIVKSATAIVIDLRSQLSSGANKTVYLQEGDFLNVCVDDTEISSIGQISIGCSEPGETRFSIEQCNAGTTLGNVTCSRSGAAFALSGLQHSGAQGGTSVPEFSTLALLAMLVLIGGGVLYRR